MNNYASDQRIRIRISQRFAGQFDTAFHVDFVGHCLISIVWELKNTQQLPGAFY